MKIKLILFGILTGMLNGFFGAGGGLIAVPALKSCGLSPKSAHATSIATTLPLSVVSAAVLLFGEVFADFGEISLLCLFGIPGAFLGAQLLKKLDPSVIKRIFGAVMIISGIRMLMR